MNMAVFNIHPVGRVYMNIGRTPLQFRIPSLFVLQSAGVAGPAIVAFPKKMAPAAVPLQQ